MKAIITQSLNNSMSYQDYKTLVKQMVAKNSTTGDLKNEAMAEYTKLNDKRMKRWDKTIKLTEAIQEKVKNYNKKITWLVLTESWCGDAAHIMPVMNKLSELNNNIDFKVVLRDNNEALMNLFLTNGGKSIPKLIMIDDETQEAVNTFGPRPSEATKMVNDYKKEHGTLTPEFKENLQVWYNKNKAQNIIEDLTAMLN